jgi:hypothetical protein
VVALKLVMQVAVRDERKTLQKQHCNNGHSAMLSFITHNHKVMVVANCDALLRENIFWMVADWRHVSSIHFLGSDWRCTNFRDALMHSSRASQKSVHQFFGFLVLL